MLEKEMLLGMSKEMKLGILSDILLGIKQLKYNSYINIIIKK